MSTLQRPGVYLTEVPLPNVAAGSSRIAIGAFIGDAPRGPKFPQRIESWTQYVNVFGGFPPGGLAAGELPYAVYNYFANGGRVAYVLRRVASDAVTATASIDNNVATATDVLKLDADNPGVWGNDIRVRVTARSADRFDLEVQYRASRVENWVDLSLNSGDSRYAINVINSNSSGSSFIQATNLSPTTVNSVPTTAGGYVALAGGAEGTTLPTYASLISLMDDIGGPFLLAMPGETTKSTIDSAIAYAETRGDVFVIIDTAKGVDAATATTLASTYTSSSYAAVYYPWVEVIDPVSTGATVTRMAPPSSMVAGLTVRTDAARGVFKAPAGTGARLFGAVNTEFKLTDSALDNLNVSHVNAIRSIPGLGVVVMGARTLKKTAIDRYIPARRSLIYLKETLKDVTGYAVFEPNDPALWASLTARCNRILNDFWLAGGLKGSSPSEAYFVLCNGDNNPPNVVAAGEVHIEVGVALQTPAEYVIIRIGQWEGSATAEEVSSV